MKNPKFEVFKSPKDGQYYYHLKARNGEKVMSGEGYTTREGCLNGIATVVIHAGYGIYYQRHDDYMNFSFSLKSRNGEIIGRSENYYTSYGRDRAINLVKALARKAAIIN
jgi:uncharacterized protein YegP (UPF0339 family)